MNTIDETDFSAGVNGGGPLPSTVVRRPQGGLKPPMPDDNDLRRYLGLLREQWLIITATALAITLAVYVFSLLQPQQFRSTATVTYTAPSSVLSTDVAREVATRASVVRQDAVLANVRRSLNLRFNDLLKAISVSTTDTENTIRISATTGKALSAKVWADSVADSLVSWDKRDLTDKLYQQQRQFKDQVDSLTADLGKAGLSPDEQQQLAAELATAKGNLSSVGAQIVRVPVLDAQGEPVLDKNGKPKERLEARTGTLSKTDDARVSTSPVAPQPVRNALIGLLAGLLFGCAAAVARDRLDRRLRTMEEVEGAFHLPVLGVVPKNASASRGQRSAALIDFADGSRAADAYRTIRTNLTMYGIERGEHRIVVVTSALAGEGKSGAVANIASAFASAGLKVLAISADLRAPALHQYFDEAFGDSLIDVLSGELRLGAAVRTIEPAASLGGREGLLHLLANDKRFPDPAVLYASPAMAKLLVEARRRYDVVIIDTPPVLSAGETPLLSRQADATVLVTNLELANKDAARRAMNVLEGAEISPIGLIVTNPPNSSAEHGFGYGYGYGTSA